MSIYATFGRIQLEKPGSSPLKPEWVGVWIQGVPAHIGSTTLGFYDEDPYGDFLPPPRTDHDEDDETPRAVVFVTDDATEKNGAEYEDALLTITGREYMETPFPDLLERLYVALRNRVLNRH